MKKTVIFTAVMLLLSGISHATPDDTTFTDVRIQLAFEQGSFAKSELRPIAARLEELISSDGSIDPRWLHEVSLAQLDADRTPYSRTVKLTDGKKVLKISLD